MASRKSITSAVYALYTVVGGAFVVSSTVQIALAVFAEPSPSSPSSALSATAQVDQVAPACAAGLRTLTVAVDRGIAAASAATDAAEAQRRYRTARGADWDDARQHDLVSPCASEARGADAVAAVSRLDRAAQGAIRRQNDELAPVRRAVDSFIR